MSKNTNDTAKKKKMSRSELESTVNDLENKIKSSKKGNALLRKKIAQLEKKIKTIQAEKNSHPNIETNLVKLQKKIAKLETENLNYLEEIKTLKGEQVPEKPVGKVQQLVSKRDAKIEDNDNSEIWQADQITEISTNKVQELISKRHSAIVDKKAGETKKEKQITEIPKGRVHELVMKRQALMEGKEISEETPKEISNKLVVNSIAEPEISTKTPDLIKEQRKITQKTSEGRIKCPECGNQNKRLIRESIDRTYLISVSPKVCGKKFKCGECGAEWR